MSVKLFLALSASLTSIAAYIPYIIDIFRNKTKPHLFSWLVWSILVAIAFASQVAGGERTGAWLMGINTIFCLFITGLSFKKGTKDIQLIDWICMFGALIALALWIITKTPFLSVIMIIITDALAFIPTFRKSFNKPYQETIISYILHVTKFVIGLTALKTVSVITALYPAYLVFANGSFVIFLYIRRRQVKSR